MLGLLVGCLIALVGVTLVHFRRLGWWMWLCLAAWAGLVVWAVHLPIFVGDEGNLIGLALGSIATGGAMHPWLDKHFSTSPHEPQRLI